MTYGGPSGEGSVSSLAGHIWYTLECNLPQEPFLAPKPGAAAPAYCKAVEQTSAPFVIGVFYFGCMSISAIVVYFGLVLSGSRFFNQYQDEINDLARAVCGVVRTTPHRTGHLPLLPLTGRIDGS